LTLDGCTPHTFTAGRGDPETNRWRQDGDGLMNGEDRDRYPPAAEGRDWRRIHHSPVFWVGVVLCLAAILIYVWSDDLSWRPSIG
jgi:hypothetical protein